MWFSCSLGGNWNDLPVPSCWNQQLNTETEAILTMDILFVWSCADAGGDKQQKYRMTQIVVSRPETCRLQQSAQQLRWHPGYCTLSPPPQICTVWQKYNHITIYLLSVCGVQWSNLSSLIYSVFLLLLCSCLWSILVQCECGDQPGAANCPVSTQCKHRYRRRWKIFFGRYI